MSSDEISREFPKGLLNWYEFKRNSVALLISSRKDDVLLELLEENCETVTIVDYRKEFCGIQSQNKENLYDYIVLSDVFERLERPIDSLAQWKRLLKPNGHFLVGANNRLGAKYFCGDRDPYTDRSFDGIENYRTLKAQDLDQISGRCYSKAEIRQIFAAAGMSNVHFNSVMPDLDEPQLIYSEDYLPKEELAVRYFPRYNYPDSVFLEEQYLYADLIENGMFHIMANAFLVEYAADGQFSSMLHATVSLDRGVENALVTVISQKNGVKSIEKRALYEQGVKKIVKMQENARDLESHGINMVKSYVHDNKFVMPYIDAENGVIYLERIAHQSLDLFIKEMDEFKNIILKSSETAYIDEKLGVILKKGYIDLVPLNCFHTDEGYLFFDQEFYYENYPANVIIYRMVSIVCTNLLNMEIDKMSAQQYFIERYGLEDEKNYWIKTSDEFTNNLRNKVQLWEFENKKSPKNYNINSNRQKVNYSQADYQKIFLDLFEGADNKQIIIFGSGIFGQRFVSQFGKECNICAVVDNNKSKWGKVVGDIVIQSPEFLENVDKSKIRVIICVKSYVGIVKQLHDMGIEDYKIYDSYIKYPSIRNANNVVKNSDECMVNIEGEKPKKYHTGYIAGVFDLFHIGHLNMFKRAKEQCDYLIVGVVSDAGVRKNKGTEPFVPFEERIEMVRSCRYVDEAVEIPFNMSGTKDAYRMYHFDCQFSGSDYINDPNWLAEKEFLEKNGAEMVFFPYTESTSSTKLKKMIDKKLL